MQQRRGRRGMYNTNISWIETYDMWLWLKMGKISWTIIQKCSKVSKKSDVYINTINTDGYVTSSDVL